MRQGDPSEGRPVALVAGMRGAGGVGWRGSIRLYRIVQEAGMLDYATAVPSSASRAMQLLRFFPLVRMTSEKGDSGQGVGCVE